MGDFTSLPKISVVICTRNEEKNVGSCLESLRAVDYPPELLELIVVDNHSQDRTRELAKQPGVSVFDLAVEVPLENVKNFRGAQLNFGVSRASGEIIFYPDADMTFARGLFREAASLLRGSDALFIPEVVCGRGLFGQIRNFERSFYNASPIDAVRFVKKSVFEAVGGFDQNRIEFGFDDWDFTKSLKKASFHLGITTQPLYHHEEELTLAVYLSKKAKYAQTYDSYVAKWGKEDPDVQKQFSLAYRYLKVFIENGKWWHLLTRPHLTLGMFFIRFLVGLSFLRHR